MVTVKLVFLYSFILIGIAFPGKAENYSTEAAERLHLSQSNNRVV